MAGVYNLMRMAVAVLLLSNPLSALTQPSIASEEPALSIATEGQRSTFQIGERIPIDQSFTGPTNKQFELNNADYDHSGRMGYEQFEVEPQSGWRDPLESYFSSSMGFAGGGMFGLNVLSPTPTILHVNLNEWIRFDQPGNYTVVITSHRVHDSHDTSMSHRLDLALRSNPIHIKIVPADAAWQRARFAAILSILSAHRATLGIPPPELEAALADMRYLGASQAIQWMAQHLRDDEPTTMYECAYGLMGLNEAARLRAVSAMNKLILDPAFPVSNWFLTTLSVLQVTAQDPEEQRIEREQRRIDNWKSVLDALPAKHGSARATTAQTLFESKPSGLSQQMSRELDSVLAATLSDLPEDRQASALQNEWVQIKSPALLPTLQKLAQQPLKNPGSNMSTDYSTRELKSIALKRWHEIDPDGATQAAISQIGSSHPSMTAESLYFLGKQSLPQFESAWAQALLDTADYQQETALASLMAHYGTGSATEFVRQKAEPKVGEWACAPQAAALGYLLKFDPSSARPLIEKAIQARGPGKTACNHSIIQEIAEYSQDPILNELAIQALDDPDHQVTMDALIYLMSYGDASDEQPISDRYNQWSQESHRRSEELDSRQAGSLAGNWQEIGLGENLAFALTANQGWLASEKLIQSTIDKCIGEQMCLQLNQLSESARSRPYVITASTSRNEETYEVAQYRAKSFDLLSAKISQFPKGTHFVISTIGMEAQDQLKIETEIKSLLEMHGMNVDPASD